MLELQGVGAGYGDLQVLWDVSMQVKKGEKVALVGANSAGKTTLIRMVSGLCRPWQGQIRFQGERIDSLETYQIVERGIVQVPEGRHVFPSLTVRENLELGSYFPQARHRRRSNLERVFTIFPALKDREKAHAGALSGGQQQMLAIGRALMAEPSLLMLDEPSLGLAPKVIGEIYAVLQQIVATGMTVLVVEQNVHLALNMADRGYVLEKGRVVIAGEGQELLGNAELRAAYLGAAAV